MPKNKVKLEVIKKISPTLCYCCSEGLCGKPRAKKGCPACKGTGKYKEYHYIMIVGNIAFDGDTLK
jgi:hypothetical protein